MGRCLQDSVERMKQRTGSPLSDSALSWLPWRPLLCHTDPAPSLTASATEDKADSTAPEGEAREEMRAQCGAFLQEHPGRVTSTSYKSPNSEAFLLGGGRSSPP